MIKKLKDYKMHDSTPEDDDDLPPASGDNTKPPTEQTGLFKPQPEGEGESGPLDLGSDLQDFGQEDLHLPALDDLGENDDVNPRTWFHPDSLTREDVDRQDEALSTLTMGKPATVFLSTGPVTYMRLTNPLTKDGFKGDAGRDAEKKEQLRLTQELDTPVKLIGPTNEHAIDEVASVVYARTPIFAPVLQALRDSAHLSLAQGAHHFHFRPTLVVSGPGMGKTTLAHLLAEATGLPLTQQGFCFWLIREPEADRFGYSARPMGLGVTVPSGRHAGLLEDRRDRRSLQRCRAGSHPSQERASEPEVDAGEGRPPSPTPASTEAGASAAGASGPIRSQVGLRAPSSKWARQRKQCQETFLVQPSRTRSSQAAL